MIKNFKFTLTSIVSIIILLALAFVFMTGFINLRNFFQQDFIKNLNRNHLKMMNLQLLKTNTSKDKVVDVDSDEYKID